MNRMANNDTVFGLKAIIRNGLNFKLLIKDILIPFLISFTLAVFHLLDGTLLSCINSVLELSLSIIPSIVGLSLTAYTIVNAFVLGSQAKELKTGNGVEFITKLNSSFAICLIISLLALIFSVICQLVDGCNIYTDYELADSINFIALILLITLLIYSIWCLFWIVIDIFNIGQTRALFDKE